MHKISFEPDFSEKQPPDFMDRWALMAVVSQDRFFYFYIRLQYMVPVI